MTAVERQHRIEAYIQQVEFASLEELARQLDVSISTARRDLNLLEANGIIRRTHGGARLISPKSDEFAFSARDTHQLEEKELIGKAAASLIQDGHTVIIDAGTTTYHVARQLQDRNIQLVTNSLPAANLFAAAQRTEVIVSGGVIYPRLGVLVGPLAVKAFSEIHADIAIMGAGGITEEGVTNSHALLIDIQKAMLKSARHVVFCLDHTKFGRKSLAFLCALQRPIIIVTDGESDAALIEALRARGVAVLVAYRDGRVVEHPPIAPIEPKPAVPSDLVTGSLTTHTPAETQHE
jgi:DeoR family transcriptional regulator, fructose operon transcriptional repressor